MVVGDKYTEEKHCIGIQQEKLFLLLMSVNKISLKNLNDENVYSSVDFQLGDTNIYIELKHRRIKSDVYSSLVFDKKKVDNWNASATLTKAIIYIAFTFEDDKKYFIKYNKELFDTFKTDYIKAWNTTNYLIPVIKCIELKDFLEEIASDSRQG